MARQRINATPESSSVSISTEPVSSAVRQFGERPSLATPDVSSHPDTAPQSAQTKTVTGKESKETKANSPPTPKPTPKPSVSLPGTPGTIKRMKDRFGRLASLNIVSDDLSLTQEGTSVNSPVPGEIDGIDESHAEFTPIIKPLRYNTPRSLSVDPSSQGTAVQELSKPTTQQRKEQRPPIVEEKERDNSPSIAGRLRRLKQKREVEVVIPLTSLSQVGHRKLICNPSLVGATSQPDSDSKIDQMVDIDSSKALDKRTSYARGMTPDNSEESTARVAAELEGKSASTTEVEGSINNDIRADDSPAVSPLPAAEGILGANLDLVRTASSASPDAGDFAEDSDADKGNVTGKQIHARAPRPSLNTFHGRVGAELERKSASTTEVEGSINDDIRADGSPAVLPLPAAEGILGANLDLVRTASSPSSDVGDSAEDSDADKGNVTGKQIHARAPHPSLNTFPSLNDIAARQDLFSPAATPHPSFPLAPVTSLASGTRGTGAGTGADDEESSSSGSDSDSDGQFSIPKEKRAGSKLSKPRKAFASLLSYLESRS
ncbi:hypothetical protein DFH11DRAFT_430725 [Phellopilus nigrolimitatus]|nr:hypothetical protein DFH11DRAFT_430725 [Phellopilus nigrolimitatus]